MRKYLGYTLLCLLLLSPSWALAKSKKRPARTHKFKVTNSIYFGGEYSLLVFGQTGGGYIGVETNFGNPYISLLNDFGMGYLKIRNSSLFSEHLRNTPSTSLHYSVGMRIHPGTRYVFIDLNAGVASYFATPYKKKAHGVYFLGTISLGFDIPLAKGIGLQIAAGGGMPLFVGFQARVGLQFKL